jgi:hypothetical protein
LSRDPPYFFNLLAFKRLLAMTLRMRRALRIASSLIPVLALAACGQAKAGSIDPTDDFDCAIVTSFFHEAAKSLGAPDDQQWASYVISSWYTVKLYKGHPDALATQRNRGRAMFNAIAKNPRNYSDDLKACTARAIADPRFRRFDAMLLKNKA